MGKEAKYDSSKNFSNLNGTGNRSQGLKPYKSYDDDGDYDEEGEEEEEEEEEEEDDVDDDNDNGMQLKSLEMRVDLIFRNFSYTCFYLFN